MAALDVALESALDSAQPSNPPTSVRRLDDAAKVEIDRLFRRGISPDVLAARFHQTRPRVDRVLTELRAKRIIEHVLDFMPDPSFETPGVETEILATLPEPAAGKARRSKPPEGLPPTWRACTTSRCYRVNRKPTCSAK